MTESTGLLATVIEQLRDELIESAAQRPANWEPLFDVREISVELQTKAVADKTAKSGIRLYVLTLGLDEKKSNEVVHRITVKLTPSDSRTRPADVRDDPLLRGT